MLRVGDTITYQAGTKRVRAVVSEVLLTLKDGRQIVRLRLPDDDSRDELEVSTDLLQRLDYRQADAAM